MAFQWHSTWAKRVDLSRKLDIPKGTNWNLEPKDTNRECQAIAWLAPAELVRSFGDLQASAVASNVPQPTWEFKPCFEAWRLFFRCLHLESTDQYRSILVNIGQYWSILVKCFTEIRYIQLLLHSPDLSSPLRKVLPDPHWISLGTSDVQHFVVPSQCRRAGIDFLAASWFSLVFHVQLWIKFTNATRFVTNEVPTTSRNIPQHTSNMCHPRSSSYIHQVPSPSHRGVHHIPKGLKGQQRPILEMKWAPQPFSDQNVTWMQKKNVLHWHSCYEHYEHCELSSHFGFGSAKCLEQIDGNRRNDLSNEWNEWPVARRWWPVVVPRHNFATQQISHGATRAVPLR